MRVLSHHPRSIPSNHLVRTGTARYEYLKLLFSSSNTQDPQLAARKKAEAQQLQIDVSCDDDWTNVCKRPGLLGEYSSTFFFFFK